MKKIISFLIIGLSLLLIFTCEKSTEDIKDIRAEIEKEMAKEGIHSLSAGIVKKDEIVWEGNFGYTDVADLKPTSSQSLYTLMSISKLILSTAVMQLWEQEKIDLESDINQYLPFEVRNPNFPNRKITTSMLLNHSSGLAWPVEEDGIPDFHHFYFMEEPPLLSEWIPEYILPDGMQYRTSVWKDFAPGEKWLYSNIGTSLLALIVEQISGEDYREYCKTNILEPLMMNNSSFWIDELDEELLTTPFDNNGNPMNYYTCRHYPVGFLSSSLEDFSHFMITFLNQGEFNETRILEKSTVEKMFEIQNPASGISNLWQNCLGDCIGHKGGGTGFSTWAEWHLNRDEGLFIFSNKVNDSVSPGGRIYELVRFQSEKY